MTRKDEEVLRIVTEHPGSTGYNIWQLLHARSRAARWFGQDSGLAILFGGPSIGGLYISLCRLEELSKIKGEWMPLEPGKQYRRRQYFATAVKNAD